LSRRPAASSEPGDGRPGLRQNLFFAFVYNVLGVPVAAGVLYPTGCCEPIIAPAEFQLVSVVGNALRLRRARIDGRSGKERR
jgi:cation transport ATPase